MSQDIIFSSSNDNAFLEMIKPVKCSVKFKRMLIEYPVSAALVRVGYTEDNDIVYCVDEPDLDTRLAEVLVKLVDALIAEGMEGLPGADRLYSVAKKYGVDVDYMLERENYAKLSYFIKKGLTGYGPLYPLMVDDDIEEIAVDGPNRPASVFHRRVPIGWMNTNIVIGEEELDSLVLLLSRRCGKAVSIAHPYAEGLLPEGHRVAVTYSREVSRHGSSLVIRKHVKRPFTIVHLIGYRMLTPLAAAYLWLLIENRAAILVVGPTAAGKTTLLQALVLLLPYMYRIVTIEDTPELNLSYHPHWDSLITRHTYTTSEGEDVDLYKLAKFALRRRADYIVIGEVRGEEAKLLVHAAASGHGVLATFHAESPSSAIDRLRAPPISIGDSFIPLIWCIVTVKRFYHPKLGMFVRRVVEITEIVQEGGRWKLNTVFTYDPIEDVLKPVSIDEVLQRSRRLRQLAEMTGFDMDQLRSLLSSRVELLASLAERHEEIDVSDVVRLVNNYYRKYYLKLLER